MESYEFRVRYNFVRVVYSDESGTGSLVEEPLTVVAALMLNIDSQFEAVSKDLEAVRPSPNYEFHGKRLFRDLRNGRRRERADTILRSLLSLPIKHSFPVFYAAIDRVGFARQMAKQANIDANPSTYAAKPYDVAFVFCLRSVHTFVYTVIPKERVLWIADKNGYERVTRQAHQFIQGLAENNPEGMNSGVENMKPQESIVDTIYFGDSKQSAALQLADVCCSAITLHLRKDPRARPYYSLLEPRIVASNPVPIYFSEDWDSAHT